MMLVSLAFVSIGLRCGRLLAVQTASMLAAFAPGDALWVSPDTQSLKLGQVVSYRSRLDPRQIVSHRVVAIDPESHSLTTAGDNLDTPDPPIRNWDLLGRAQLLVPKAGYLLTWLFSWPGLVAIVYVPASLVLFFEVKHLCTANRARGYCLVRSKTPSGILQV